MAILREIAAVRGGVGLWARDDYTIARFHGKDALSWLHSQTTNEVSKLPSGQGNIQALLDRSGRLLCYFHLFHWHGEAWVIVPKLQAPALEARMESHLFLEDVSFEDVGQGQAQLCVEGPRALLFLGRLLEETGDSVSALPQRPFQVAPLRLLGHEMLAFSITESGEDGFLLIPAPDESDAVYEALLAHAPGFGAVEVGAPARRTLQLESGLPLFPEEVDEGVVIAETPLESLAVSYDKGCYLGQEVVARIKAYGSPKHALSGLIIEANEEALPQSLPAELFLEDGSKAGILRSAGYSPGCEAWIGRAYLTRNHRKPGQRLTLRGESGGSFVARVEGLPLYTPSTREAYAQSLYHEALAAFEADTDDVSDEAIELLEEVLILQPAFEDAYEVLGVILHRHHRVDEAIAVMKRLAAINPESIMAHTNLSVFYVSKGLIPEAEAEKAIAAQLETRHTLNAREAQAMAAQERARIRQEAEERMAMFEEVLSFDPEDIVATMGLGSAYLQLERYEEAAPWFEKAVQLKKDYSAAYLNWGKCLEFLERIDEAATVYGEGIEAASRKGDLMPLREMERRLKGLQRDIQT